MSDVATSSSGVAAGNGIELIQVPLWSPEASGLEWLWHGFSTRAGGVSRAYISEPNSASSGELNLGFTSHDSRENVVENRLRFAEAVTGSRTTPLRTVQQIHSCVSVTHQDASNSVSVPVEADGILTREPGVLIGVMTADCIPVLVVDPMQRAVAAFHAGWRGSVERIVELGIARMEREFGSDPEDLLAAIGAGIGPCCYTVGEEVFSRFTANFRYASELFSISEGQMRINLWETNRRQLIDAGVRESAISIVGGCTSCRPDLFYSHRASGGHAGRMMAAIGIRA